MQVNAINSFNSVNFAGRKNKKAAKPVENNQHNNKYMDGIKGSALAAMFLVPVVTTQSCDIPGMEVSAKATAIVVVPGGGTVEVPPTFEFPTEIEDSLNIWRGDIIDIEADGDDGDYKNKALLYIEGDRNWDYNKHESAKLNLKKSRMDEAIYDHGIADSIKNDIRVTKVKPGEVTVIKKDGTRRDNIGGLLFNEDGVKTFAHSNGRDQIFIYKKELSGENRGKFVEVGTVEAGYLPQDGGTPNTKYGQNVLLNSILAPGTEDHYIQVKAKVMDVEDLKEKAKNAED